MIVTQDIKFSNVVTEQLTIGAGSTSMAAAVSPTYAFTNGTSVGGTIAGTVDKRWEKSGATAVTLAAGASVTYVLSALTDDFGRAVAFARLRSHVIHVTSMTSGDYLTVGGAASNPCTDIVNGTFKVTDHDEKTFADGPGAVVAVGSADQIKILNSGTHPITFEYALSGCST